MILEMKGEGQKHQWREGNIDRLPLTHLPLGIKPTTGTCAHNQESNRQPPGTTNWVTQARIVWIILKNVFTLSEERIRSIKGI